MKRLTDEEILEEYKLRKSELESKLRLINDTISQFGGSPVIEPTKEPNGEKKTWKQWFNYCLEKKDCTISDMVDIIKPHRTDLEEQTIKDCLVQTAYQLCKNYPEKYTFVNMAPKGKLYKYSLKK